MNKNNGLLYMEGFTKSKEPIYIAKFESMNRITNEVDSNQMNTLKYLFASNDYKLFHFLKPGISENFVNIGDMKHCNIKKLDLKAFKYYMN